MYHNQGNVRITFPYRCVSLHDDPWLVTDSMSEHPMGCKLSEYGPRTRWVSFLWSQTQWVSYGSHTHWVSYWSHTQWVSFWTTYSVSFLWATYSVSECSVEKLHYCLFLLGGHRELERPGNHSFSEPVGILLLQLWVTNVQQKFHRVQRVGKGNLQQENKQNMQLLCVVHKTLNIHLSCKRLSVLDQRVERWSQD